MIVWRKIAATSMAIIFVTIPQMALARGHHFFGGGGYSHSYGYGSGGFHGFSLFHTIGSFGAGYLFGRFFHPFGGYYSEPWGYAYHPFNFIETVIDLVILLIVVRIVWRIIRGFLR